MSEFLKHAWTIIAFFLLINFTLVSIYRKKYKGRIFIMPPMETNKQLISGLLNICINVSLIVYSIFLPLNFESPFFIIGGIIALTSLFFYALALITYAKAEDNMPAIKGIYKISRHPMQVFTAIIFLGIGIATLSYLYMMVSILGFFVMYPTLIAQEKYCLNRYGNDYANYMKTSPRFLLFI
jgi:protein-S-isoprenylcysteine O-methyltransferase Ste14